MPERNLKERIQRGETLVGFGARSSIERDAFRRIAELGTYDFVFTDSQHAPYSEDRLVAFCAMAAECGLPVHFRIKHTRNAYLIGNYLDLGPSGVEVPQVETAATVAEALASFYYPPRGQRSYGGAARAGDTSAAPEAYARWWNEYGVLWLQLESVGAVTGAFDLARPGVDCLSFGPTDLGFDLAHRGHPRLKSVDECVRYVVQALEGTKTAVCFRSGSAENRSRYADMGVRVFLETPPA